MLKELLPKLSQRLKPNPVKELPVQEEESVLSDPNLLDSFEYGSHPNLNFIHQAIITLRIFILLLPLIFVGSLFANDVVDYRVTQTGKSIEELNADLLRMQEDKNKADQVYRKTEILKTLSVSDPVSKKVTWLITQTPPGIRILSLKYTEGTFKIKALSDSALGISLLINNYFQNPAIGEITLRGAELEEVSRNFKVELEVFFQ